VTDFTESALQALTLLEDNQNHLAMRLDLRVRHILIDEFQDTSLLQYRLIKTLIAEWTPHSGKTLFLVGDPMQSIYRFRQANVGIFLDAKHHGIPPMPLTFLQLTQNFRSDAQLIHAWNQHFSVRMPTHEDLHAGAISFASSTPTRQFDDATPPEWISELAEDTLYEAVYQTLLTWQTEYPQDSIALLVHSRRQLTELLPYLSQRGIRWHAQDIQPMQHIPAIQDALSLTRALLHTGDEIAWASVLRSPWIQGSLTFLTELFAFKAHQTGPSTLWECLKTLTLAPESLPSLAQDAQLQTRLHRLIQAFERAFSCLGRIPTALCVKALWQDLNRSLALDHHEDPLRVNHPLQLNCSSGSNKHIETLETFWDCMKSTDPLLQEAAFLQKLSGLYASRKEDPSIRLSVMTIHKSKGLEFDRVILLDQAKSKPSSPLLRFHSYSAHGEIQTLLAPKSARGQEASPLFQFLSDQEKQQDRHERERVRYVGCTRARKALKVFEGT
jgi:ATP-dependent exoDNAse (exonuclease V) beta subunit